MVAGVPPDAFAVDGQLWGNPIYDWAVLRATGYRWWIDRVRALLAHVDLVRLDHFRAFAQAWHVPTDATTARSGRWMPGPGADLVAVAARELDGLPLRRRGTEQNPRLRSVADTASRRPHRFVDGEPGRAGVTADQRQTS